MNRKRGPPTDVPTDAPRSARKPARPTDSVPGADAQIPTSSQRPWQGTNQRIPYTRFFFSWPTDVAAPREMLPGDIVFVHKMSQAMGHGANRMIKCSGISQLNEVLGTDMPMYTTLPGGDTDEGMRRSPAYAARLLEGRRRELVALCDYLQRNRAQLDETQWDKVVVDKLLAELAKVTRNAGDATVLQQLKMPWVDWQALEFLSEWSLDGVLINVDDEVLDMEAPHDQRHDAIGFNVCVGGPTLLRNTPWQRQSARALPGANDDKIQLYEGDAFTRGQETASAWEAQLVDPLPQTADRVYIGLFQYTVLKKGSGDALEPGFTRYQYRAFTQRQFELHVQRKKGKILPNEGGALLTPRSHTFSHLFLPSVGIGVAGAGDARDDGFYYDPDNYDGWLVGVWRLGTLMDTNLVRGKHAACLCNVVVEPMSVPQLYDAEAPQAPSFRERLVRELVARFNIS